MLRSKYELMSDLGSMTSPGFGRRTRRIAGVVRGLHTRALVADLARHTARGQLSVGRHTYGLPIVDISSPIDRVQIGSFCSIGPEVRLVPGGEHNVRAISTFPFSVRWGGEKYDRQVEKKGSIQIGNDVWIGSRATILSGVNISHGAVVAAGSLVNRDVAPFEIVGGVPCRNLGFRFSQEDAERILESNWWELPDGDLRSVISDLENENVGAFIDAILELRNTKSS